MAQCDKCVIGECEECLAYDNEGSECDCYDCGGLLSQAAEQQS